MYLYLAEIILRVKYKGSSMEVVQEVCVSFKLNKTYWTLSKIYRIEISILYC